MEKDREVIVATREQDASPGPVSPKVPLQSEMSLEKAKKLIRKTSREHAALFRRLAQ